MQQDLDFNIVSLILYWTPDPIDSSVGSPSDSRTTAPRLSIWYRERVPQFVRLLLSAEPEELTD
jgi:hypothetical protein